MTASDVLEKIIVPFISAIIGAFLAFLYQKRVEKQRDKKALLQALMAYRNVGAWELDWIKSLNLIDIVYEKDKKVRELLHKYFEYTKPPHFEKGLHLDVLYNLIYEMGRACGYKNLELTDIRDVYAPEVLKEHYPTRYKTEIVALPPES